MNKPLIIAFLAAIGLGFILLNPWNFIVYLLFLAVATAVALILVVISLVKRNRSWKSPLLCLAVLYTAALSSCAIQLYLSSRMLGDRKRFLTVLYDYRNRHGHFPKTAKEVAGDISSFRGNYITDTSLKNFELFTTDLYGFPNLFTSKDSAWEKLKMPN